MEKAKVWFTDLRAVPGTSLQDKLRRLLNAAGFAQLDLEKKFVAIKINFGEPGNLSYLRANWARTVADMVKAKGGIPFLTDCNTLYVGRRKNAVEHIEAAWGKRVRPAGRRMPGDHCGRPEGHRRGGGAGGGGVYCKTAKIGRAVMDADVVINLVHFKGHESTGFGGALKNLGMGCGSRAGKMEQHNTGKPSVHEDKCRGCHACTRVCAQSAISFTENNRAHIDHDKCVGCGRCLGMCNFDAIENENWCANTDLVCKIAEYAKAVVDGRPCLNVNFVMDISPTATATRRTICRSCRTWAFLPRLTRWRWIRPAWTPAWRKARCPAACSMSGSRRPGSRTKAIISPTPPPRWSGRPAWPTPKRSAWVPGV